MPRQNPSKRYISMPPYSRDAEHKYILKVLHQNTLEIKEFHRNFIQGVEIDYQACVKCMDTLLEDWKEDRSCLETWRDYITTVSDHVIERKLKESSEFKNLHFICDRTSHFEGSVPERCQELKDCIYDHLYRYCVSFEFETKGNEIASVRQYESDITQYRQTIDTKIDELSDYINQFHTTTSPFYEFVSNGKQEEPLEDVYNTIIDICQTARAWIKKDRQYSNQIWQEMQKYQSNRTNLKEEESILLKKRAAIYKQMDQIEKLKKTAIHNYVVHKSEKRKLERRIDVVEDKRERIDITREGKRNAYDKTLEYRSLEHPLTPRMQITYDIRLENLRREVQSLDGQVDPTIKHLEKLKIDLKEENNRRYEFKVEAATHDNDQHDLRKDLPELELEIESTRDGISTNESKLVVMQKIRCHIAMADTLRKLHRDEELEKYQPDIDNLNEALQMVSENLGREWRKVYPKLPFIPPRDQWKKTRDIELLDMTAMRCDQTHEQQAFKAFEKWLTFNRRGNIQQLIRSLRKARKVELASQIEEKYMVEDVY